MKKTILMSALFLLTALFLIGCTAVEKPPATPPTNVEKVSLQPFFDAGCSETGSTYIKCTDIEFIKEFNCLDSSLSVPKNGKNLGLPLVRCNSPTWSWPQDEQLISPEEQEKYFECGGGLSQTCKSYITYKDNKFIQIKNKEELLPHIGVIDTEDKALALVLLSEGGSEELIVNEKKMRGRNVEVVGQNFLVTVYAPDRIFGCFDEINHEAIKYDVTSEGDITERSREIVYNEQLEYDICVD